MKTETGKPKVSVVIPCYNYEQYLEEAVESVIAQTFQDFEIIIVDDGSTDSSQEVARGLMKKHAEKEILLITQKNKGLASTRNAGIAKAQGKYILPLDADDKIAPQTLEKMVEVLDNDPKMGLVYSWVQCFGDNDDLIKSRKYDFNILKRPSCFINCSSLFRRKAWEITGGYNPKMKWGWEDLEFWINCGKHRFYGKLIPEPLLHWRRHGKTMTHTVTEKHLNELAGMIRSLHPELYPELRRETVEKRLSDSEPFFVLRKKTATTKKALLIMPGHGMSTSDVARGYGDALVRIGWDVFDYGLHERLIFYRRSMAENLKLVKDDREEVEKIELSIFHAATAEIPVAVIKELPDIILYVTGQFIPRFPLELIQKRFRIPQVIVLTESPYLAEMEKRLIPFYDIAFTNDKDCVELFRKINKNTYYLPTAYASGIYPYKGKVEEDFQSDLLFFGTAFGERAEFMNKIVKKLKGVDFKLFGAFTKKFGLIEEVYEFWEGSSLEQGQIAKYLAGTKISLNIFRTNSWEKGLGIEPFSVNPRVYETMASGALLMTDYRPELESIFEIGKDLVVFDRAEDFLEKMRYYLAHEEERKKIAQRGQAKVLGKHSYINRAERLIEIVEQFQKSRKKREVKLDASN